MSYFKENYSKILYPLAHEDKGLRKAQLGAIHSIASHFTLKNEPAVVVMPTGSGKTAVLMMSPFVLLANRVLIITPSRLVRSQINKELKSFEKLKYLETLLADTPDPRSKEIKEKINTIAQWEELRNYDIVVGTPFSLSPMIETIPDPPQDLFDLILVDEAHHSASYSWRGIIDAFPEAKVIQFTATPFRRDNKEVKGNFIYTYPLIEAINDNIFGEIEYVAVNPEPDLDNDVLIAKKAENIYNADKDGGYEHYLVVRTDSRKRADYLSDIYRNNTNLRLEVIHSNHSYRRIEQSIEKLQNGELDGVICVNMLGEGFDFPRLKIAAIHSPHKSLEITLQFIGRFARTNADNIDKAKFIAIPTDIEIGSTKLYYEGATWPELITNLSQTRNEREKYVREVIRKFGKPEVSSFETEDLSLYSLKPYNHLKIYQVEDDVNINNDIEFPEQFDVIYKSYSEELNCAIYIVQEQLKPKWTDLEFFRTEYHLFLFYYEKESKLFFINASKRTNLLFLHLVKQFSESYKNLPLVKIDRVLKDIENAEFFNIGMKNRVLNNQTESYRIIAGPSAQEVIKTTDGKLYDRGHIFGKAKENDNDITIGYSSGSKVWSHKYSQIPDIIEWCKVLANKINSDGVVKTNSNLDILNVGEVITEFPEDDIIVGLWNEHVYKKPIDITYVNENGAEIQGLLTDLEINIDLEQSSKNEIIFTLNNEDFVFPISFRIDRAEMFSTEDDVNKITIISSEDITNIIDYLNSEPINFYTSECSRIYQNQLFRYIATISFDKNSIKTIDWISEKVEIQNEAGIPQTGFESIHTFFEKSLQNGDYDIVFYDHGSHEIADFVTLKEKESVIAIELFHCKASHSGKPGDRVGDVYEVTGQCVKSLMWLTSKEQFFKKLIDRVENREAGCFIIGDKTNLIRVLDNCKQKSMDVSIMLIQPGITKKRLSDKVARILASANDYIISTSQNSGKLIVISSE